MTRQEPEWHRGKKAYVKRAVILVIIHGHFNLPTEACLGINGLTCTHPHCSLVSSPFAIHVDYVFSYYSCKGGTVYKSDRIWRCCKGQKGGAGVKGRCVVGRVAGVGEDGKLEELLCEGFTGSWEGAGWMPVGVV